MQARSTLSTDYLLSVKGAVFLLGKLSLVLALFFTVKIGELLSPENNVTLPEPSASTLGEKDSKKESEPKQAYSVINSRNVFGSVAPEPVAPVEKKEVTNLTLRLVGTNLGAGDLPFAILEDTKKKEQDIFDLSESVFDQAKLVKVDAESVVVEHDGKKVTLVLEEGTGSGDSDSSVSQDGTQFTVEESELDSALANLPRLLSQARAVPYFRNGQSVGMRLFAIRRGSLYEKLGLKNGDILKSVNDNSLADPAQALKIFEKLRDERSIGLVLERQGEEMDLQYAIR